MSHLSLLPLLSLSSDYVIHWAILGTERDAHVRCCNLLRVQCLSMAGIKTTKQAVDELFLRSCGNVYLVTLKAPTMQNHKHKTLLPHALITARASLKGRVGYYAATEGTVGGR